MAEARPPPRPMGVRPPHRGRPMPVRPWGPMDVAPPPRPMEVNNAALPEDPPYVPPPPSDSPDFEFEDDTHPNRILEGLNNLRLKQAFCDVILCCGGSEFPCHRNVLAAFSSYFEAMFESEWMESHQTKVAINGVEPQAIGLLVEYAYTSRVLITTENAQALLAAANLLNIMAVQQSCCEYMERHMDEKNCIGIHCFAEAHSCHTLEKRSKEYILEHFSDVYRQEELLCLSVDKLTEILSDDDLNVSKEETVFEAAMLWLNKCPSRSRGFEKVLEQIRLPLISPFYLRDVIERVDVVKQSQACQRIISESRDHRPQPRTSTVTEVIVAVGGQEDKEMLNSVESFEPTTGQWKTLACLPFAVRRHCLVVSGSTLYLAGGELADGSVSRDMWRYDPSSDSWLEMAPMNEARCDFGLVMLDGCLFAVGGREGQTTMERYNPKSNSWQFIASVGMTSYCDSPAVVALDGFLYYIGGSVMEDGYRTDVAQCYRYNPKQKPIPLWTEVAPMHVARFGAAACTLNGKIYIIGGWHSTQTTEQVECFDPQTNQWTLCSPMKRPRCHPGVAVVDGNIYVLGGKEGFLARYHQTIERYGEERDTWDIVGDMPTGRSWFCCVSLRLRRDGQAVSDAADTDLVPEDADAAAAAADPPDPPPPDHPFLGPRDPRRFWERDDWRFLELDPLAMRMWRRRWRASRMRRMGMEVDLDN